MIDDGRPELEIVPSRTAGPAAGADQAGWESVYRETVVMVYRYIYARVGNRPDAEDLTTSVYMRALPRLRLPAALEEIRSYLVATARTVLADHWRDHYDVQFTELDDDLTRAHEPESSDVDEEAGVRRASEVLARLPDHYRKVLELRFLRGYSLRETAAAMGLTLSNVKVMQFRAIRRAARDDGDDDGRG